MRMPRSSESSFLPLPTPLHRRSALPTPDVDTRRPRRRPSFPATALCLLPACTQTRRHVPPPNAPLSAHDVAASHRASPTTVARRCAHVARIARGHRTHMHDRRAACAAPPANPRVGVRPRLRVVESAARRKVRPSRPRCSLIYLLTYLSTATFTSDFAHVSYRPPVTSTATHDVDAEDRAVAPPAPSSPSSCTRPLSYPRSPLLLAPSRPPPQTPPRAPQGTPALAPALLSRLLTYLLKAAYTFEIAHRSYRPPVRQPRTSPDASANSRGRRPRSVRPRGRRFPPC
ncbi:hypothetical protein B0H15DRAFT_595930 [Mycena belliarum]|uniref:Uncharacterized protein n=1 Tax=Mycena belliarum TaxID=1033014 RepID=A0AAD6XK07_9AGAR|nr:hypothetical protein B0H15DRAFT_595930 [Mycena belliae]